MNSPGGGSAVAGLRILEVTQRYPPALGGVERHVERLVRELSAAGATVEVVTSDLRREQPFSRGGFPAESGPVPVRRHRSVRAWPAPHGVGIVVPGMLSDLLRTRFDVVHAHSFGHFPTIAGRLGKLLRGVPLVVTPHSDPGTGTPSSQLWSRSVIGLTVRGADRTVALSQLEAAWLARLGAPADRICVIPAGIDVPEFASLPRRARGVGPRTVLFVGRLDLRQKGLEPLVRAFALLPSALDARLRVVGEDWGGLAPAAALARSLGVGGRVTFVGAVSRDELLREYAGAELFVLPSLFDSFPVVVAEAMATGLPVVATRVGGVPEIVADGETGVIVPAGDPPSLAEAMGRVLSDPALGIRWGEAGRRRVSRLDWSQVMPAYLRLFSEVHRRPRGRTER
jgi:glycosyltransferase involved in cell wall biosynthesis